MSRFSFKQLTALLVLPFFTVSCLATQTVHVEVVTAPELPIQGHAGVGVEDLVGTSPAVKSLARDLTSSLSATVSDANSGFKFIDADVSAKIRKYVEEQGQRWDNFDPAFEKQLADNFGGEVPMSGSFSGKVSVEEVINAPLKIPVGKDKETKEPIYRWMQTGYCLVKAEIRFTHIGSGVIQSRLFSHSSSTVSESAELAEDIPALNFTAVIAGTLSNFVNDFKKTWVISTQRAQVPLFVGDGFFDMPWESDEYPQLANGFARMSNGDYELAQAAFSEQLESLTSNDDDMQARTLYNQAAALGAAGNLDEALSTYLKAQKLSTDPIFSEGVNRCRNRIKNRDKLRTMEAGMKTTPEV